MRHPRSLYVLFFTEMWERFSFYGMRALLSLYLINQLQWQPSEAAGVYKWYTSLVYLTPLLGGFLADRVMGLRAAIITGGVLMALGHFALAFQPLPFFFTGLALLVVGNGFFKPNISTVVGKLYAPGDPRRDSGFTLFYMGINVGALGGNVIAGLLADRIGWHAGFAAAGVGMVFGVLIYLWGQGRVAADVRAAGNSLDVVDPPQPAKALEKGDAAAALGLTGFSGVLSGAVPWLMFAVGATLPALYGRRFLSGDIGLLDLVMPVAFGAVFGWMGWTLLRLRGAAKDKSVVIFVLFAFSILFWMGFEQSGNALNVWAAFNTRLDVSGFRIPPTWFQATNALFVILLAPVVAAFWTWTAGRGREISAPFKFALALGLTGLAFVAMTGGAAREDRTVTRVPLSAVPSGVVLPALHAGRLRYDPEARILEARGVFPPFATIEALTPTVSPEHRAGVEALAAAAEGASPRNLKNFQVDSTGEAIKAGLAQEAQRRPQGEWLEVYDEGNGRARLKGSLDPRAKTRLLAAGAPSEWRTALQSLERESESARVSGLWLVLTNLLLTLAELCLSPVGLSTVTKLAPARFTSLFMGVWFLGISAAYYLAGSLGELWGRVPPVDYFQVFVWTAALGTGALLLFARPLRRLMHGVE